MNYYDENGHQIGYSNDALFGGQNFYDESGHHVGYSTESLFGGENFYSDAGGRIGYTTEGLFGGHNYYDSDGSRIGYSVKSEIADCEPSFLIGKIPVIYAAATTFGVKLLLLNHFLSRFKYRF